MPRNGSGTFSLPQAPFVTNTTISSTATNSNNSDIAAALTQSISKDGQTAYTGNQPMGGSKLTGLGVGTASSDSVNMSQLVSGAVNYALAAGTDTITITPTPGITAYAIGQRFVIKIANTNTGAVTLNVNSVGAGAVTWPNGTALVAGDLVANAMVEVDVQATTPVFHLQTVVVPPLTKAGGAVGGAMTGALNEAKGADIPSVAGTTDIGAATGTYANVTGTNTPTGLGTVQAGTRRIINFSGVLLLTHNATSLILPGAANITTAAGDAATFVSLGSGNWKCATYTKASGAPVSMAPVSNSLSGNVALNNTGTYFTGPTVAQGSAGTWFASGQVLLQDAAGTTTYNVLLTDGTTTMASATVIAAAGQNTCVALSGFIASPAGNIRFQVKDASATSGLILFDATGTGKDSTITAIRIA